MDLLVVPYADGDGVRLSNVAEKQMEHVQHRSGIRVKKYVITQPRGEYKTPVGNTALVHKASRTTTPQGTHLPLILETFI